MSELIYNIVFALIFGNIIKHYGPYALINLVNTYFREKYNNPAYLTWKWAPQTMTIFDSTKNINIIYNEVIGILKLDYKLPSFDCVDPTQKFLKTKNKWKVVMLQVYGNLVNDNIQLAPKTMKILSSIKSWNIFVSIFEPRCVVPFHIGPCKGLLTYHLAIKVPKDTKNCYMIVNQGNSNYKYTWKPKQSVLYDDSYPNTIVNKTNEQLVLLYINFKRILTDVDEIINNLSLQLMSVDKLVTEACERSIIKQ